MFTYTSLFSGSDNLTVLYIYPPFPLSTLVAIATIQKLQNFALQPMQISKRYNSVPVKDNCALFAPIFGSGLSDDVVKISPLPNPVATATNFGTKLTITRLTQKTIARCFHLPPIFGYAVISCKFFPEDPCCHGNQPFLFKDKIGCRLTRASNAETQLLG